MNELQKELDQAFNLVSAIPVSGGGVDVMAAAREHLRRAYQLAVPPDDEEKEDTDGR